MPNAKPRRSDATTSINVVKACPVEQAIHVIGGKWKLLLLRTLLLNGPQGYNELLERVAGISSKELTRNLRELAASGMVTRSAGSSGSAVLYHLTPAGEALMPTFKSLLTWGQETWYAR